MNCHRFGYDINVVKIESFASGVDIQPSGTFQLRLVIELGASVSPANEVISLTQETC